MNENQLVCDNGKQHTKALPVHFYSSKIFNINYINDKYRSRSSFLNGIIGTIGVNTTIRQHITSSSPLLLQLIYGALLWTNDWILGVAYLSHEKPHQQVSILRKPRRNFWLERKCKDSPCAFCDRLASEPSSSIFALYMLSVVFFIMVDIFRTGLVLYVELPWRA